MPDKAIDLLDEAAAYVAMHSPVIKRFAIVEKEMEELKKQLAEIEENPLPPDADDAKRNEHYELVASIRANQLKDEAEFEKLKAELATIELTVDALARVIEIWTGVPAGTINANEFERLGTLDQRLNLEMSLG